TLLALAMYFSMADSSRPISFSNWGVVLLSTVGIRPREFLAWKLSKIAAARASSCLRISELKSSVAGWRSRFDPGISEAVPVVGLMILVGIWSRIALSWCSRVGGSRFVRVPVFGLIGEAIRS